MQLLHEPSNTVVVERTVNVRRNVDIQVTSNQITSSTAFTATVGVLAAEANTESGGDIKPDVIAARVVTSDPSGARTVYTLWPDGNSGDSTLNFWQDNLYKPSTLGNYPYTTGQLPAGSEVALEMRAPKPDGWTDTGRDVTVKGTTYDFHAPDPSQGWRSSAGGTRWWVRTQDRTNAELIVRKDGETVPTHGVDFPQQRKLGDILAGRLSGGTLDLDSNEVAILFELSTQNAQPSNAPAPNSGGGNPDYNDAVAIIDINLVSGYYTTQNSQPVLICS